MLIFAMTKREFIIDNGNEKIQEFGYLHKNVAVKYPDEEAKIIIDDKKSGKSREPVFSTS